jgi:hypothetical protein
MTQDFSENKPTSEGRPMGASISYLYESRRHRPSLERRKLSRSFSKTFLGPPEFSFKQPRLLLSLILIVFPFLSCTWLNLSPAGHTAL